MNEVPPEITAQYKKADITEGDTLKAADFQLTFDYLGIVERKTTADSCQPDYVEQSGDVVLQIGAQDKTCEYTIKALPKIVSISAEYTGKELTRGDKISDTAISVIATYSDESTENITGIEFTPQILENYGENIVTVSYCDLKCTCIVNAKPQMSGISMSIEKTIYEAGKAIPTSEITVKALYEDNTAEDIEINKCKIEGRQISGVGKKIIKASYKGFTTETEITAYTTIMAKELEFVTEWAASWRTQEIKTVMGQVYNDYLTIRVPDKGQTRYCEWYSGGKYNTLEGIIATNNDADDENYYVLSIYADNNLVYMSPICHRRLEPFSFSANVANAE